MPAGGFGSNPPSKVKGRSTGGRPGKDEEKRLRVFRKKAPKSFLEKLARAQTERSVLVPRVTTGEPNTGLKRLQDDCDWAYED